MANSEDLRKKLVNLLENFKSELKSDDLREKVQALVPAMKLMNSLGKSLSPAHLKAARDRILNYFQKYPFIIINKDEIIIVAGISEWARRLRELRVQFGWMIVNGQTLKEMHQEEGIVLNGVDVNSVKPHDYVLLKEMNDRDAAYRWHLANDIRRRKLSVRDKILEFMKSNIGKSINGEELRYVAGNRTEWARRVRELRTEFGWSIVTKSTGRPDLPIGFYVLENDRQAPEHDRKIPDVIRSEVLQRDNYQCKKCKWNHKLWNKSDPRHLEAHHVTHHVDGGKNVAENLITVCNKCHDQIHSSSSKVS